MSAVLGIVNLVRVLALVASLLWGAGNTWTLTQNEIVKYQRRAENPQAVEVLPAGSWDVIFSLAPFGLATVLGLLKVPNADKLANDLIGKLKPLPDPVGPVIVEPKPSTDVLGILQAIATLWQRFGGQIGGKTSVVSEVGLQWTEGGKTYHISYGPVDEGESQEDAHQVGFLSGASAGANVPSAKKN